MPNNISTPEIENTPFFANSLIAHFKTKFTTRTAACEKVAPLLGIHHKTIMIVANGGYCGKLLGREIEQLYNELILEEDPKSPQLWVKVICLDEAQKERFLGLSMPERRRRMEDG